MSIQPARGVWSAEREISISVVDLLSYTFGQCEQYGFEKPIFVDAQDHSKSFSAGQTHKVVRQLVKGFQKLGIKQGDCVCLHSYNHSFGAAQILYPLLWLGVIGAGGCVVGSNPGSSTTELIHLLKTTNARFVVSHAECQAAIFEAASECQILERNIFVFGEENEQLPVGPQSWETLLRHGQQPWKTYEGENPDSSKVIALCALTSGTTGLPKAAELSHHALVAQCEIMLAHRGRRGYQASQLICLPIFHAFALPLGILLPLREGITTYFLPRFNLQAFTHAVNAYSITDTAVVPPIITSLLNTDALKDDSLRSLRYIICAGAPMIADVQVKLCSHLAPEAVIAQCWGMTELGQASTFKLMEKDCSGSVGRLLPNIELKIIDDDGCTVTEEGKKGEAYLRSPGLFGSYRGDNNASKVAFDAGGFYRTGDRVHVSNGKVFIDGRVKDIMKVKGWQVGPEELEKILLGHPDVLDVAVAGIVKRDMNGIEEVLPRAYVVRRRVEMGSDLNSLATAEDLTSFVAARVISYKRLVGGVVFIEEIPRSSAGKILRKQLVEN